MTKITKFIFGVKSQMACVALLTCLLIVSSSSAQSVNTNYGKNFWFGYTQTYDGASAEYVVYINTFQTTNGTVSVPGMAFTQNFTAVAGVTTRIVLPSADVNVTTFTGPVNMAVNVVSDSNVAVFAAIEHSLRTDNSCILPVSELGNQYYIMNCNLTTGNFAENTEFMVVDQGCIDTVEIIPSQNITIGGAHAKGVPYTVVLQPNQVLEVQCDSDLTGTLVMSLNHAETGVIAGSTFDAVECHGTGNPFYEELFPTNTWGENYVFLPTPHAEDKCRIFAGQNATTVIIQTNTGTSTKNLNAGQYFDTLINAATPVFINGSNPISVGRFMITASCNEYYVTNPTTLGDPSEAIVDANEQMFLDSAVFYISLTPDFDSSYVQIVTRTTDVGTILLDNVNVGAYFTALTPNPLYSYASIPVAAGSHTLTSTGQGFLAYTTGLGDIEAETGAAGVYLKEINLTTTVTNPTACNPTAGSATAAVTGIRGFLYSWSDGQTTQTATGLSAGTYTITVSDSDCVPHTTSAVVTITPAVPLTDNATIVDTSSSCNSGSGSATITVSGGTGPYTYSWTPGGFTTATVSTLSVGTYTVTITDNNGCPAPTQVITISQPGSLYITIASKTVVNCEQFGYIVAHSATGGTAPYTYNWTPYGGNSIFSTTNLTAGTYTITVTDSHGCTGTASETISYPPQLTSTASAVSGASCYDGDNGSATSSAAGGTPAYTYSWFPSGGTNANASGLSAGDYTVTVTDSMGCVSTASVAITQAPAMNITIDSVDEVNSNCNGQANVNVVSGGTPPYTYLWSPGGQTTASISGICSGVYCCTITQNDGCSQQLCVLVENTSGIENIISGSDGIIVYPNPSNGEFTIQSSVVSGQSSVEIYNVLGQKMYSRLTDFNTPLLINLSDKASGVYFYRVIANSGNILGEGKLIIQK